ncbi:hypothetical protein [Thermosynechococcus sp. FA-CM-4201]
MPKIDLLNCREAASLAGLSRETLKKYRREKKLIEGVHYFRINQRKILYNAELLVDFLVNRDIQAHLRKCEKFLKAIKK